MKNIFRCLILFLVCVCPRPGTAELWLYEDGGKSISAAILCHGKGGDPEYYVVDPLRLELNEQLGWHTISLQMPGGRKELSGYKNDLPAAYVEIDRAILYLKEKGVKSITLIAHSLGSRMASSYLAENPKSAVQTFIGVGMLNNGGPPFNCLANLQQTRLPVLDIWGGAGKAGDNKYAIERKVLLSQHYTQIVVPGGDHALSEHEDELVEEVIGWLRAQQ